MSEQEQDLTPTMQEMIAKMSRMQAELNSLKERANVITPPVHQAKPVIATTRRNTLKKLGLALLGGAATATALGAAPEVQARVIANPQTNGLANRAGMVVLPPGAAAPTGTAPGAKYGLIASGNTTTLDMGSLPVGNTGVYGNSSDYGVCGSGSTGVYGSGYYGVLGISTTYAGYFGGNVFVSGTVTKAAVGFKIDHPQDPANKYLYHTGIESPDMKNVYDGVVTLNDQGESIVTLPGWFEALNSDFRYQLTCLGQYAPVFIAEKIQERKFKIAGGQPGQEVSWQVTGIRQDAYAKAHRMPVEEDKIGAEKGKYLHPELFGQPEEMSVHPRPEVRAK